MDFKKLRKEHRYSKGDIAKLLGISVYAVTKIEAGEKEISSVNARKLKTLYSVEINHGKANIEDVFFLANFTNNLSETKKIVLGGESGLINITKRA